MSIRDEIHPLGQLTFLGQSLFFQGDVRVVSALDSVDEVLGRCIHLSQEKTREDAHDDD
jgi:hypothetical protein